MMDGSEWILEADVLQERSERVLRARRSPWGAVRKASGSTGLAIFCVLGPSAVGIFVLNHVLEGQQMSSKMR